MSGFFAGLGAGLVDAGSSLFSAYFNREQAKDQMHFQEQMSSSAHQREVVDLRAAGLNPILSATGGSGASTPSGAMATMQPQKGILGDAISTALAVKKNKAEVEAIREQIKNTKEQTEGVKIDNVIKGFEANLNNIMNNELIKDPWLQDFLKFSKYSQIAGMPRALSWIHSAYTSSANSIRNKLKSSAGASPKIKDGKFSDFPVTTGNRGY